MKPGDTQLYVDGVLANNRRILARTITLIESALPAHQELAKKILDQLIPHASEAVRLGITGVPGVGKSTFIENFGLMLLKKGYRVAVLAVDPSSTLSGGSVMADKTRMEKLSVEENAFIRPSPSGGTLGGVTIKTRETLLICEAAGFDVLIIETVGVGQSEIAVASMVDFFLVLMLAGAGDELQGIKKGKIPAPMAKKVIDLKIGDYLTDVDLEPNLDYQKALIVAMKKEKASFKLYTDLAAVADDENLRSTFLILAQEEAKHKLRFEVEYDDYILSEN